jgi:hypothetical protein
MGTNWTQVFLERIDNLSEKSTPKFGKMNVSQMICHCTDQIRSNPIHKKAPKNQIKGAFFTSVASVTPMRYTYLF